MGRAVWSHWWMRKETTFQGDLIPDPSIKLDSMGVRKKISSEPPRTTVCWTVPPSDSRGCGFPPLAAQTRPPWTLHLQAENLNWRRGPSPFHPSLLCLNKLERNPGGSVPFFSMVSDQRCLPQRNLSRDLIRVCEIRSQQNYVYFYN